MPNRLVAVLAAMLAVACGAVLAVVLPASARADEPIQDPNVPVQTVSGLQVTPEGDVFFKSASAAITVATSAHHAEANFAAAKRLHTQIFTSHKTVERWNGVMGVPTRPLHARHLASIGLPALHQEARGWKRAARAAYVHAHHPPHLAEFLCIHSAIKDGRWSPSLEYIGGGYPVSGHGEGSWTASGKYYGGLQMDLGFQNTYNPRLLRLKGTADHWTPLEQVWTAEKAEKSRGFGPWPNTARACGLPT